MSRKKAEVSDFEMSSAMKWTIWVQAVILVWSFTFNHVYIFLLTLLSGIVVPFVWGVVDALRDNSKGEPYVPTEEEHESIRRVVSLVEEDKDNE